MYFLKNSPFVDFMWWWHCLIAPVIQPGYGSGTGMTVDVHFFLNEPQSQATPLRGLNTYYLLLLRSITTTATTDWVFYFTT